MSAIALLCCFLSLNQNSDGVPLLPTELPLTILTPDQEVEVYGRFGSWVGDCLTLEGSAVCFQVEDGKQFPILRSTDYRTIFLVLRARWQSTEDGLALVLLEATQGPEALEFFIQRSKSFSSTPAARSLRVLRWGLGVGRQEGIEDLTMVATGELRKYASFLSRRDSSTSVETLAQMLSLGQDYIATEEEWLSTVTSLGDQRGNDPEVANLLEEHGFVFDLGKWRREADLLADIGLVRLDDRVVTIQGWRLEREILEWEQGGRNSSLLRSQTPKQYSLYAQTGEIREGMSRLEALKAWGYAEKITWVRKDSGLFEAWFYGDQWVCLLDGLAFSWSRQ